MNPIDLKSTFDTNAEAYNQYRPTYPAELFGDLIQQAHLVPGANLLEIGAGTGQATLPLAERNFKITAIEFGSQMAAVARRELEEYPNVEVVTGAFEDIELPSESFDLVYSATAFHWIKPEIQFTKPHKILKDKGCLAIIHTHHIDDEHGNEYYTASRPIYAKYERPKGPLDAHKKSLKISEIRADGVDTKLFEPSFFKTYVDKVVYTADELTGVIGTYSPTLAMEPKSRSEFLNEIQDLVNEKFGGKITKYYGFSLTVARKI